MDSTLQIPVVAQVALPHTCRTIENSGFKIPVPEGIKPIEEWILPLLRSEGADRVYLYRFHFYV